MCRKVIEDSKKIDSSVLRHAMMLVVMLIMGATRVWGQTKPVGNDYSGTYYIASYNSNNYNSASNADNYYLCPSTNYYDGSTKQKPFLTTHKPDNTTPAADKPFEGPIAKWRIVFAATIDNVDYYYIKHISSGGEKYIVHNEQLVTNNNSRVRVHLQSTKDAVEDNNLFYFTVGTKGDKKNVNICPKAAEYVNNQTTTPSSLNYAKANTDYYDGQNTSSPGYFTQEENRIYCGGLIGYWLTNDNTGLWYLEDIISNPVVSINSGGKAVISSSDASATFYYTTDGTTTPTTGSNPYTTPINITGVETIKAIAVVNGESSNVATYTVGTGMPYIIQNQECTAYYLVSGDPTATNVPANTSSITGPKMEWLLKYAGNVNGIQYYYFVNNATKNYLYRTGDNIYVKAFADNDDGYKFNFIKNADDSYNIYPKDLKTKSLYKTNGNIEVGNVKLSGTLTDAHAHWMFISTSNIADKRTLFEGSPVSASNYYKIASLGTPGSYIISPVESGGIEYAGVSSETNDNMVWMFEEAGHDEWQTYYNIVSATTGKYMYYVGPAAPSTPQLANAIEMKDNLTDNERYQFVLARATDADYYYIIPKTHKDVFTGNKYYSIWLDTSILKTILHRASGGKNVKWKFENAPSTFIAPPFITFNSDDMKVYMASSTQDITKIQYSFTKDAEAAPTTATTDYSSGGIDVKYGPVYHFVGKTIKGENESILSPVKDIDLSYIETPTVEVNTSTRKVTFSTSQKGITFYYTTADADTPSYTDKDTHTGDAIEAVETGGAYKATIDLSAGLHTIRVIAVSIMDDANETGYSSSAATKTADLREVTTITSLDQIVNKNGIYKLSGTSTITGTPSVGNTADNAFEGILDGEFKEISLSAPLFKYVKDAIIKNVIISSATISASGNVGAITCEASGDSRIYNCGINSGSVSGSNYVGGLVGLLDGASRVINCYSYANITGGSYVGGIVGYNNVATTSTNLKTMVMNCMFYGEIDTENTTNRAPIYNGQIITNKGDASGVSNFNYFWSGASYVQSQKINTYNCALAAETRFLQRFEFFRHLLNSNRALAAWWATGDVDNKNDMMKWVLEPSQIGSSNPYPILKSPGYYPSVVNIDATNADAFSGDVTTAKTQYNQGRKFGSLTINIRNASSGAPNGATITTTSVTPNITDKDPVHFNFNYYKVQLPYYNDVGTKNYTDNKVVTGWKIVSISDGTNSFSTGSDASATVDDSGDITLTTPYNFADRKSTDKDKYSDTNKRVFNQGAYFDVPEGVTSITIEPYWGNCVYVSDEYLDVVYKQDMSQAYNATTVGGGSRYTNGNNYNINGSSQKVYTKFGDNDGAINALNPSGTVYDNAIVLVGNVHSLSISNTANNKPYTIMSIDLDKDNEPDYSYILRFDGRVRVHPVRVDFLNVIGLGMAQKTTGGTGTYNFGIMQPYGWFEVTNTGLFRVTQFEYDVNGRATSPIILHGGVIEQWVTYQNGTTTAANSVQYYHVGSNVWFKEFHMGVHQDRTDNKVTPHPPVSVTGGDFKEFYLTGLYNSPDINYDDNAECYINGGHFEKIAGTGMQGIGGFTMSGTTKTDYSNGNIIWQIDNADIDEFYAGGINAAHIAEGDIITVISNSRVDQFCGGPKFGDMNRDKKVVTNATNCIFRTFFGAGYGGNSYNRRYPTNRNSVINTDWDSWADSEHQKRYNSSYKGVETRIDYQFLPMSGNTNNVARLFVDYVSFSLATTYDVTSKLTDCTITKSPLGHLDLFEQCLGNFYGGGSLGKVSGPVRSTLTNCIVEGNVFGAGYSATLPSVKVMGTAFQTQPHYDENLGAYLEAVLPATETYTWEHAETVNNTATAINTSTKKLFTTIDLSKINLGSVSGAVTLTITTSNNGKTIIGTAGNNNTGHIYGGGDESAVNNISSPTSASTTVTLSGDTEVLGNVFGGGNQGVVSGSTTVNIED